MPKTIISEGKTTNEAIEKGLKELGVSKQNVEIKVLESDDKRSFFSILAPRVVKVELTLKEDNKPDINKKIEALTEEELNIVESNARNFLDDFLAKIDSDIKYTLERKEFGLEIIFQGNDSAVFIGYRGEVLYDLQNIITVIANKNVTKKVRVILDIEGYKEKRVKALETLALRIASKVEKDRRPYTLEPMRAYERKIIHSALQNSETVTTKSIGEEPKRRIVISLK